jgi:hypothetical protein
MQEKPSEELDRVEGHDPLTIAPLIVFPSERYLTVLQNDQAPLGDGHTMGGSAPNTGGLGAALSVEVWHRRSPPSAAET